jgi:biopolymer transport protein ExbD
MKCLLYVCLATSLTVAGVHAIEQSVEASQSSTAQMLQKGVSVKMAAAGNAQPMPEADNADAWIITVTADGQLYFGVDPLTPAALQQRMIRTSRKRSQRLYIKADARASFASVQKALDAASVAEFESPVLLVSQQSSSKPGTMVAPEGLEVLLDGAANSGANVVVELNTAQGTPTVKVDDREIPLADLHDRLLQLVQSKKQNTILLRAGGRSKFADVAQVIDACRAAGAKVLVAMPVV